MRPSTPHAVPATLGTGTGTGSPNQLLGGSTVSVPASCSVSPAPAQPGNGSALVGGNVRLNAGSVTAHQIFRSQSAAVTNGPGTTVVSNAWTAPAVANDIGGINASNCTVALSPCKFNGAVNPSALRSVPMPGSLPLLGGAAAIGWSRRIRRRLKQAQQPPGS